MRFFYIFLISVSFFIYGNISHSKTSLVNKVERSKRNLASITKKLEMFERNLNSTSEQFSKVLDLKNNLINQIRKTEGDINLTDESLKKNIKKFKKILLTYESLDYSVEENDVKYFVFKKLSNKKQNIIGLRKNLVEQRLSLKNLEMRSSVNPMYSNLKLSTHRIRIILNQSLDLRHRIHHQGGLRKSRCQFRSFLLL